MSQEMLLSLLKTEVRPALGCTEPAAVAFAVAKARDFLGGRIEKVRLAVSGNIFKNALAVTIPNTQEAGLEMASVLGLIKGESEKGLEVFGKILPADVVEARMLISKGSVEVKLANEEGLFIEARVEGDRGWAEVVISGGHTNIVKITVNGEILFKKNDPEKLQKRGELSLGEHTLASLVKEVESFPFEEIAFLQEGLEMNLSIAKLGVEQKSGLALGAGMKSLVNKGIIDDGVASQARIAVAGACDARMAGMNHPVMSSMGSGNHGLVAILPVAIFSQHMRCSEEKTLRALALSHLVTAFVKQHTGRLSTMCGCALAAGSGAAAAITWLNGGTMEQIEGSVQNIIGNLSGMICDGAKGGCALKLSTSASEAILSAQLSLEGVIISSLDGIISPTVEETILNLGKLSVNGMNCAEKTILDIMLHKGE